jgi:hypothetical protein
MKFAAAIARSLQADMQAELRDIERAASNGTRDAGRGLRSFALVFRRELRWLRRRPVLLFFTTILPLLLMSLLIVVFSAGLPTALPIAVLDRNGTDLSRP